MSDEDPHDMKDEPISGDAVYDEIRARLVAVLGDARLPTGLPVAHALADIFLSEARQQGRHVAEQAWKTLDTPAIEELGRQFTQLISRGGGPDTDLPAGATMMARLEGTIFVNAEDLGLDIDRPGLHRTEDLPVCPGGSNLALLLDTIKISCRKLRCRAIGIPTVVERMEQRHPRYHLQFPPFGPAGDVVLQRSMDFPSSGFFFCGFSTDEVFDLAAGVVSDMRYVWKNRFEIALRVSSTRRVASGIASGLRDVSIHAITIELNRDWLGRDLTYGVEFETWDHGFRRGVMVQEIDVKQKAEHVLSPYRLDWADEAERVHTSGAHGQIDGLAHAIVEAAPQGAQAVLADLADRFETHFLLPTPAGLLRCRLYWWRGVICVDTDSFNGISVRSGAVEIRNFALSETVAVALRGKPLHVVFDEPFRCSSPIETVNQTWLCMSIKTKADHWLVNCETGRMWRERGPK